jgi:hypothetical protein
MATEASRGEQVKRPDAFLTCLGLFVGAIFLTWSVDCSTRWNATRDKLEVDEAEYYDLAGQLIHGQYEFSPRRVIGHPAALALMRLGLGDQIFRVQLCVSLIFSLTAPLTYLLTRRELGSGRAALLAGLGVMAWPNYVRFGAMIYSEALALPVFAAMLLTFPGRGSAPRSRSRRWLCAGLILGICMQIRPMYLLYSPFAALIAYTRERGGRAGMAAGALLAAGCLVVVLPWSAFMSAREGTFVLLSSNGGETIAGGLNPELVRMNPDDESRTRMVTPGGRITWVGPGKWLPPSQTGYLSTEELALPYSQMSSLLTKRSLAWIMTNPSDAYFLTWRKLALMWAIYPVWNGWSQTLLGNVPTVGLLILSFVGLVRLRAYLRELAIFWTLPIFVTVAALISWGSWRFRQPGDLGLLVLAAAVPWIKEVKTFLATIASGSGANEQRKGITP